MGDTQRGIINATGRTLLSLVFLFSAIGDKIPHYKQVVERMATKGVPAPSFMLAGAISFMILGSLSLITGYKARIGAFLLLLFTLSGTYYFHDYWAFDNPELRQEFLKSFMKNVAIIGGLLMVIANGPGLMSFDARKSNEATKSD
jgi:putative oxidoreductase